MTASRRGLMDSSVVHVGFAFVAMGGWAAFANRAHPTAAWLQAGLIQGALSAAITLLLKRAIELLADWFEGPVGLVAPPLVALIVSACALTTLHALGGTPEIAHTIAVPLTVSTSYAALYNLALWRAKRA